MTSLEEIEFSPNAATAELEDLASLLRTDDPLSEQDDLLPFFRRHRHVAAALGLFHSEINVPDRVAFEYDFLGAYRADIVIGDSEVSAYALVEIEDAGPDSIFVDRGRSTSYWSPRFNEGFSQLVDWLYELDQRATGTALRQDLGDSEPSFFTMLIVGRRPALSNREWDRLQWHRSHVLVDSTRVFARTFDEVVDDLQRRMHLYSAAS